jgi:hypothetical protein
VRNDNSIPKYDEKVSCLGWKLSSTSSNVTN